MTHFTIGLIIAGCIFAQLSSAEIDPESIVGA